MPLIIPSNSISDGGYEVDNSLRFNDGSSDYLSRTPSSVGNTKKFTISFWLKRGTITGADQNIFHAFPGSGSRSQILFNSSEQLLVDLEAGNINRLITTRVFRDTSAWYHIVIVYDSDNGTSGDRVIIYINGVRETSFGTETYPSSGSTSQINTTTQHEISSYDGSGSYFDGYLAEFVLLDGTVADATSFGEFDEDSGIWKPIDVSGLTFGTNGFYLDFENSGSLGADVSGNGNNFTVNNLTSVDQSTDTPTLNYATLNAVLPSHSSTFSEGNCKWTPSTASEYYWSNSNFGLSQGKWYMEAKLTTAAGHNYFGISIDQPDDSTTFLGGGGGIGGANDQYEWSWKSSDGKIYNNTDGGTAYGDTYTTGDILGLYLDLDNNKLYFAKNGTIQNSGTGISITDPASTPNGFYFIAVGDGTSSNSSVWEANFGNPTFSISSGNSDPNGYGNFEYSPNDGGSASFDSSAKDFYALNTKNLAEYG